MTILSILSSDRGVKRPPMPLFRHPQRPFSLLLMVVSLSVFILFFYLRSLFISPDVSQLVDANGVSERSTWLKDEIVKLAAERKSVFTQEMFEQAALKENGLIPVAAVILAWKRLDSLKFIVRYLRKYPFIKEVLIWNNNKDLVLSAADFGESDESINSEIKVFTSIGNLQDLSKYITCSMATYDYCYIQDDDWLNTYMDALYTNFLRYPSLVHTNTMPMIHIEHRRWTFMNPDVHMHTGFAWLGCGSFVPKEKAVRFLWQIGEEGLDRHHTRNADMYFLIWTNQYVWQFSNPLTPLDQSQGWSDRPDQWDILFGNMLDAAKRLYAGLEKGRGEFDTTLEEPLIKDRSTRAPCWNDKCIFLTNVDPFPDPGKVVYHNNVTSMDDHQKQFYQLDFPSNEFWDKHAYHNAVDADPRTCWNSYKRPQKGDYFGLQLLKPAPFQNLTLYSFKDISPYSRSFQIVVSQDGDNWVTCQRKEGPAWATFGAIPTDGVPTYRLVMEANCEGGLNNTALKEIRYVRLEAERIFPEPWEICGIALNGMEL